MRSQYVKLIVLLKEEQDYINGNQLAQSLGVSTRSIRNYVKDLNENYLIDSKIQAHQNKGYKLVGQMQQFKKDEHLEFEERAFFIVKFLLENQESITYEQIAHQLYFSSQTIRKDILKIQQMIADQKRELTLETIIFEGIKLTGSELDKRLFLDSLITPAIINRDNIQDVLTYYFKEWISSEELVKLLQVIDDDVTKINMSLTPESLLPIISYLVIAMTRMKQGHYIESQHFTIDVKHSTEYHTSKRIFSKLVSEFNSQYYEAEIIFFSVYLMSKRLLNDFDDGELSQLISTKLKGEIKRVLTLMSQQYQLNLIEDSQLYSGLLLHLSRDLYPILYNFYIENTYISYIKTEYIQAHNMAVTFAYLLKSETDIQLPENEIGYVALHFASFLERVAKKTVKVAIIQGRNMATADLLNYEILRRFSEVEVVQTLNANEIDQLDTSLNFVVSQASPTLLNQVSVPVVYVNDFPTKEDYQKINQLIHQKVLLNYLNPDYFFKLNEVTKEDILKKMVIAMDAEELYESILDREGLSTTDVGNEVALPHPIDYSTNEIFKIGVAINETPVNWGEKDVQLVFLILPSVKQTLENSQVFSEIYQLLKVTKKVEQLKKITDFNEFITYLNQV